MTRGHRRVVVAIAAAAAMLIAAAPASAAQRYASPTGSGTACSSGSPCGIETAFTGQNLGDEIIVNPGDYNNVSQTLYAQLGTTAHGLYGQPAPRIHLTPSHYVVAVGAGSRLSHLQIDGTNQVLDVSENAEADQIYAHATAGGACLVYGTLIDSVCWASGASSQSAISGAGSVSFTPVLRNVTAEATGPNDTGIEYHTSSGGHFTVTVVNTIVHGTSNDINVSAFLPDTVIVNIDHSNYVNGLAQNSGATINATASQTQAPAFVNAAVGDFHEAPGSPTIDAGVTSPANGLTDLDGNPRTINGATDIGADEFDPFAGVSIGTGKAKVKKGRATVQLSCPTAAAPPACLGTLTLTFTSGGKKLTAGSAPFSMPVGGSEPLKVKVSKQAAKRLAKKGKLATTATADATDGTGLARTVSGALKLKLKPKRHR